ncbi:MAG: hypothetical protein QNJ46_00850 [Leptolyngbyaceae cyanobacterium MO_188.B28]|nr:hypothetical protein [Leptolyngbyaceae cyanobacterium MO_188.B28]
MNWKRLRIAILSTALLLATNTLATANHTAESPQASEIQTENPEQDEIDSKTLNADTPTRPVEVSRVEESTPPSYPWDDPDWEIIQYED